MQQAIDRGLALEMLHAIDPGCARDPWHEIGRAFLAAGGTVDDINEWSSTAQNYAGERDGRAAFATIKPNGKTGTGTLIKYALDAGWKWPEVDRTAAGVWGRSQPATDSHPY